MIRKNTFNKRFYTLILIAFAAFLFFIPIVSDTYWIFLLINIFIGCIYALSWRILMNVGEISFAQSGMLAIGAYTSALLTTKTGLIFWAALPLSGVIPAIVAFALGRSILKLRGMFFALVTFSFSELLRRIFTEFSFFGRNEGISNIPEPSIRIPGLIDITFKGPENYYYLGLFLFVLTILVAFRLDKSRIGIIFDSIKQNELLAESLGVDVMSFKVKAFVISSFFLGLAGSFHVHFYSYLNPDTFTLHQSIDSIVYAVVGGLGNIFGPLLGALVIIGGTDLLPVSPFVEIMLYGIMLILVLVFIPDGLIEVLSSVLRLIKRSKIGMRLKEKASN
jgi:branched-chain amino acid transport system permease protein